MNQNSEVLVSDVCSLIVDCVNRTAPIVEDRTDFRMIRTTNIKGGKIDLSTCRYVDKETFNTWTRRAKVLSGDVLLTREAPIGEVGYVDGLGNVFLGQRIMQYRPDPTKIEPRYLYYAFCSRDLQNQFRSHEGSGSVVSHIRVADCHTFKINLPNRITQKNIAASLGALDDKIENNRRMNETLEEMARAIFKSWFVDFDPVHAKAAGNAPAHMDADTAALFPSSFGDDGLPVGWANKTLGDIILPKRGNTITKSKTKEGTIPVVAGGLKPAYFHNQSNVEAPVVTISASGANAGFTRLYNENIWASDCSYISKQLTDTIYFWYVFLKTNQQKIYHMQQGAAQPHIYPSDLMRLELTVPNDNKLIQHFENLISPYFQKISIAQKEAKTLAELRDTLLPKLMSGEIRVKDAERVVEAAT